MKSDVVCPVCNQIIGKLHGTDAPLWLHNHMLENHPVDYIEIASAQKLIEDIQDKYHIYARDFFYYSSDKLWHFYARNYKGKS